MLFKCLWISYLSSCRSLVGSVLGLFDVKPMFAILRFPLSRFLVITLGENKQPAMKKFLKNLSFRIDFKPRHLRMKINAYNMSDVEARP